MSGQYTNYYHRIGKGKSKRYQCVFESCSNHIVKKLSSIYSHVQRTHGYEIYEIEKEKQEEIEREKRAEKFIKQQLKEFKKNLPQIKERIRKEKEAQEKRRRKEEDERQKRIERNRRICKKMWEVYEENKRAKQQKENIRKLFAYHMIFEKEKPTWEDFYLYYLSV